MGAKYRTAIGGVLIDVEFNDCLALRILGTSCRKEEECTRPNMKPGDVYDFIKDGWRIFLQERNIPLVITEGNEKLSKPIAEITIMRATHYIDRGETRTTGAYMVRRVL